MAQTNVNMGHEIQFDDSTKFYYSIVTEEELSVAAGGTGYISNEGHQSFTYNESYSVNHHYKICKYCYENASTERKHKAGNTPIHIYPVKDKFLVAASKLVDNDDDIFYNKTIYVAFTVHGIAMPKVDGTGGTLTDINTHVMTQVAGLDIPITGNVSMSYCGENSYISVDDSRYLGSNGDSQKIVDGAQLRYAYYHGYALTDSSGASTEFACTMLYKVVFSNSSSYHPAEIYRTSILNKSKIVLTLLTDINSLNYNIEFSGTVRSKNDEAVGGNKDIYNFYITKQIDTNNSIADAEHSLTITFDRGTYPFSYNFSVLGNKILPANKNYYLCERVNDKTENGKPAKDKIIDFYFLQNYENDMTPSSCEVDIMYDSSSNENVAYAPSGSAAVYLTGKPENFVYPIFKNEANELVHYTTFLDNLKYLTVSDPASSNATSIASGFTVPIPAVGSIDFVSPENCSATHTPFGYTYQYKIDVKPKEGLPEEISNMTKKYTLNFNFLYYGSGIPYTDSSICLSTFNDYDGFDKSGDDDPNKALTGENIITRSITNMPDNASSTLWYGIYKTEGTPGITGFALYNNASDAQAISPDNDATRCISKQYVPFQIVGTDRPTGTASYTIPTSGGITGEYSSDKPQLISISGNSVS